MDQLSCCNEAVCLGCLRVGAVGRCLLVRGVNVSYSRQWVAAVSVWLLLEWVGCCWSGCGSKNSLRAEMDVSSNGC